jgi:hypothetical protein
MDLDEATIAQLIVAPELRRPIVTGRHNDMNRLYKRGDLGAIVAVEDGTAIVVTFVPATEAGWVRWGNPDRPFEADRW